MGEVVSFSTSNISEADLKAIATYQKDTPGSSAAPPKPTTSGPAVAAGGAIYRDVCSACHGLDGKGVPELVRSLARSPVLALGSCHNACSRGAARGTQCGDSKGTYCSCDALVWLAADG